MSSSFFNPSFAFSSHFDPDGAPLGELSWSSSLAVVTVSLSGLLTVVALMLACLCCKKGGIGFKELENADGEESAADLSGPGSPAPAATPSGPDVYVLPLSQVTLPVAEQPGHTGQLLHATDLGRQDLLQLKDMGHGWFGRVYLGEVPAGSARGSQVVVKELRSGASVQEQLRFLEEAQPYRALQHENLLRCLGQCAEATPYLLLLEFCPVGDLKGYLRSCRVADSLEPDPLTLQRMACEVACGILHLHRHNYVHSDLALRNCLLTAHLTVKVGDYGLAHSKYREDYLVTADQLWVPLRWIAPELVDEVHSNLLVVSQTKASNVWSLGVTLWELFELGTQPYPHHSDGQVLAFAVREQQLKLPRPQLPPSLSERWYEVMQFCWLQPEQRPTAEEVHLLLTYLCAKGAAGAEEERRWRSLRPGGVGAALAHASSFPLLEQFAGDGFHADGDDVLTVTETSRGLNFEYQWEARPGAENAEEAAGAPPGVVPVLSAHSPSVGSEYFIRLEEHAPAARHDADCVGCASSPPGPAAADSQDGSALEPGLGPLLPAAGPWNDRSQPPCGSQSPPCPLSRPPSPGTLTPAERATLDPDPGEAAQCPAPAEDSLGTPPEAPPAFPLGQWSSNKSANNNSHSGHRAPGGREDHSPHTEHGPHPLAPEGPREPLLGLQATPSSQELGRGLRCPRLCPTVCQAPATCHVTASWTEVAGGGGDSPRAEPRLAEEATGPQLPLPSIPSQEDAPLPAERASAPSSLPASPTPACQPWTAGPDSCPPELALPDSEDSAEEATPGAVTDSSQASPEAEGLGVMPAGCHSLTKQVGPPGSLPLPTLANTAPCQGFHPGAAGHADGQPRAPDSGYDTENHESPELVLRDTPELAELGAPQGLASEGGNPGPESQGSTPLGSLSGKCPYRDSAYFSDLEAEAEPPTGPAEKPELSPDRVPAAAPASGVPGALSPLPLSPEPSPGPTPQPPRSLGPGGVLPAPSPGRPKVFLLTPVAASAESSQPSAVPEQPAAPSALRPALCLALPRGRPEDEDDSEDSESDEELRCYSVQEPSEDEEDAPAPVVVVGEGQSARSLRSLLKMPAPLPAALPHDLGKKKAVSFFDDVTVYLFDQESPTREVGEPLPGAKDAGSPGSPSAPTPPRLADRPPDGAPEGGAFAWDLPPLSAEERAPAAPAATPKPAAPGPLSRFTVSPTAPVSRFSITHVSDSDAVGGPGTGVGGCGDEV